MQRTEAACLALSSGPETVGLGSHSSSETREQFRAHVAKPDLTLKWD